MLTSSLSNVTFSWLLRTSSSGTNDHDAVSPVAFGNLYILNHSYNGTPGGLAAYAASNPSQFVAESTSTSGGVYTFSPSLTLAAGTYYFYTDTAAGASNKFSYTNSDYTSSADSTGANGLINPHNDYTAGQVPYQLSSGNFAVVPPGSAPGSAPNNYFELSGSSTASSASVVPEPATFLPAVLGAMLCFGGYRWRQSRQVKPA